MGGDSCRVPDGLVDVVLSYCHHTLFDRTLEGLLPYLQGKGVGVINASVLSMGLLTPQARHLHSGVMQLTCLTALIWLTGVQLMLQDEQPYSVLFSHWMCNSSALPQHDYGCVGTSDNCQGLYSSCGRR